MKPDRHALFVLSIKSWRSLGVLVMAASATALCAQQQNSQYSPRFGMGHLPDATVVNGSEVDTNAGQQACLPWKLSPVQNGAVGVKSLNVPSKAKHDYEKACEASRKSRPEEAERLARSAIEKYGEYPAAWVMLGMSLEEQHKGQEARDACSHAATVDATYLPAYLCAAEVSTQNEDWKQALDAADAALGLKSGGGVYSNYYRATAYLHMNNITEARKSAYQAIQLDIDHDEPGLYLLAAQIYERQGDQANAIAQLHELLKRHTDPQLAEAAKQLLAKLESQQPAK
jgi:tetratricopeptide (TPR) repeat protein